MRSEWSQTTDFGYLGTTNIFTLLVGVTLSVTATRRQSPRPARLCESAWSHDTIGARCPIKHNVLCLKTSADHSLSFSQIRREDFGLTYMTLAHHD